MHHKIRFNIREVFGEKLSPENYTDYIQKAILAPENSDRYVKNKEVLKRLEGEKVTYSGEDSIINHDAGRFVQVSLDYLHQLTPSGLPEHELILKKGATIINLHATRGSCNGTRLRVRDLKKSY